jgi:hypothetical protein
MKNLKLHNSIILLLLTLFVTSCDRLPGIFELGMGWNLFIGMAVLVLIIGVGMKLKKH